MDAAFVFLLFVFVLIQGVAGYPQHWLFSFAKLYCRLAMTSV